MKCKMCPSKRDLQQVLGSAICNDCGQTYEVKLLKPGSTDDGWTTLIVLLLIDAFLFFIIGVCAGGVIAK